MKKFVIVFLMMSIILSLITACTNESGHSYNSIQNMPVTLEQKKIVDLLNTNENEIRLFSYNTKEKYKNVDIWVEVYENGELVNKNAGGLSFMPMEDENINGELALIISKTPDYQWTFIQSSNGSKVSTTSEPCTYYKDGYGFGAMDSPVIIEDGKEIILYTALFSNSSGQVRTRGDAQDFINQPDLLKEYSFAHIIKCKFTK